MKNVIITETRRIGNEDGSEYLKAFRRTQQVFVKMLQNELCVEVTFLVLKRV